jgi:hypothetical protein
MCHRAHTDAHARDPAASFSAPARLRALHGPFVAVAEGTTCQKFGTYAWTKLHGRSLEAYYQETGRAGRDGVDSEALLYFSEQDISSHRYMIHKGHEDGFISEARVQVCGGAERRRKHATLHATSDRRKMLHASDCRPHFPYVDVHQKPDRIACMCACVHACICR